MTVAVGTPFRFEAPSGSQENLDLIRRPFEMAARGGAEACAVVSEGWSVEGLERAQAWKKRGSPSRCHRRCASSGLRIVDALAGR